MSFWKKAKKTKALPNSKASSTNCKKPHKKTKKSFKTFKKTNFYRVRAGETTQNLSKIKPLSKDSKVVPPKHQILKRRKNSTQESISNTLTVTCFWSIKITLHKTLNLSMMRDSATKYQKRNKNSCWLFSILDKPQSGCGLIAFPSHKTSLT